MYNKIYRLLLLLSVPSVIFSQQKYPESVNMALNQTINRVELVKALNYFYNKGDSLKIKSINFLISNMPIHKSFNYYWADEEGNKILYNELNYSTFKDAVDAFEKLKEQKGKLHPVPYTYRDIDSISSKLLIENVELAISKGRERNDKLLIPEDDFLEYLLPYRCSVEPLQNWRKIYAGKFAGLIDISNPVDTQIIRFGQSIKNWFTNSRGINERKEPLPRLGALQLLSRQNSTCDDIAGLVTFMARSQGWASTIDFVPAWATASGAHFSNYINIPPSGKHHYDAVNSDFLDTLAREPSKVLRTTYSIQKGTIASILNTDTTQIPDGFLRMQNYKDVTQEYWQTSDIHTKLFNHIIASSKVAYLCVWNFAKWKPIWFSKLENSNEATFTNMCKGVVYQPMYYTNNKLIPAGFPIINGYKYTKIIQVDTAFKRTIHLKEQPRYLVLRPGKKYNLFYWNNKWISAGIKIPDEKATELIFGNIPSNALLLLVPEYSERKERPFIITDTGEREWF